MTAHSDIAIELPDSKNFFSSEEISLLDPQKIPKHVAIIMDGNRRWSKQQGLPPLMGHWEGAEAVTDIVRAAAELGIKTLTVYSFSTENWIRSEREIEGVMNIFELYLVRKKELMIREGIRLDSIGDLSRLPERVRTAFYGTKNATEKCDRINLVLAMNYGGRDELRRVVMKIIQDQRRPEEITEELISKYLDTNRWGDPDLLIRTSGELRVSNFLLWQISYAEIYITDVLWPDFSPRHLYEAVLAYKGRQRRIGGGI